MSVPCIELADPSSEGQRIAEVLRERGFYVVERSVESLRDGSEAALILLGGDVDGALEVLAALRGTSPAPVILLGDPPGKELTSAKAILSLGADAHYARPVSIERLVRKVETFLSPPETRIKSQPELHADALERPPREPTLQLKEPSIAEWRPPERTMQLADDAPQDPLPLVAESRATPSDIVFDRRSSRPPPTPALSRAPSQPPIGSPLRDRDAAGVEAADLSPRLRRLILDADRRLFPASPPLDLRFPAGDETPEQLVPDELLETVGIPTEPVEEDPLDAFTYVGPVPQHSLTPLPGGSLDPNRAWLSTSDPAVSVRAELDGPETRIPGTPKSRRPPPREPDAAAWKSAVVETQDEIGFGEPTGGGRGRRGELGEADALRLLWRIVEAGDEVWVSLELDGRPPLRLRIAQDDLRAFEGPAASRALEWLRERGRTTLEASTEDDATAALEHLVGTGTLGRYELDGLLRRAREDILYDVVGAMGGTFEMRPSGTPGRIAPRLLARPLSAVLMEGARRRLGPSRVRRLVGSGALAVRLTPIAAVRFDRAGIEPELVALIERSEGEPIDAILDAAPPEEGLAGALYALVAAGALRLVATESDAEGKGTDSTAAARSIIDAAAALAEDAHYFAILGVPETAEARELRAAWEGRRRELSALRLGPLGLEDLEPRLRRALEAVDEAWEVLQNPRLREAYRHALFA